MDGLNIKQAAFVREYLVDLNATQAAIRAGYSSRSAYVQGCNLLKHPKVSPIIKKLIAEREERTEVKADRVVLELARIAFGDHRKLFDEHGNLRPIHTLDDDTAAALASVDLVTVEKGEGEVEHVAKIRTADKIRALELLGRHLKMFTDKVEVDAGGNLADLLRRARERAKNADA